MDRRRYSPSAEGLEGRELLSLFGGNTLKQNTTISIQDLPKTYKQKELRIAHLPFYLEQENTRRFLPSGVVTQLQTDLNAIVSTLTPPPSSVVNAFDASLRHLFPQNTLSKANAVLLDKEFGAVLTKANADPAVRTSLQNDMLSLAKVDSLSIQPSSLAREDYSTVLQTALAVGRPLLTPYAPTIQAKDGHKILGGKAALTHDPNPTLVGTYQGGTSNDGAISMQIVDQKGDILGTAPVSASGTYTVKLATTLTPGRYDLYARASDEVGHLSYPSRPFLLGYKPYVPPGQGKAAQVDPTATVVTTTQSPPAATSVTTTQTVSSTTQSASAPRTAAPAAKTVKTTNVSSPGGPLALPQ